MLKRKIWLLPLCAIFVLGAVGVLAQELASRALNPGTPVTGLLDADNFIQVFTVSAEEGQSLAVTATNEIGIPLAVVITNTVGDIRAQVADADVDGEVTLDVTFDDTGVYYITVFKAAGVSSVSEVEFTLTAEFADGEEPTLEPVATSSVVATSIPTAGASVAETVEVIDAPDTTADTPSVTQLLTTTGMTINLSWTTTDDLDLEIRDPVGGSLYWQTPTVNSGGTLGPNLNQGCAVTTSTPVETASWSPGGIPTGSYEVLVYYQQSCAGDTPVTFSVEPIVDGTSLGGLQGTVLPGQVFVSSFTIGADGAVSFSGLSGIVEEQILPDTAANLLAAAQPVTIGSSLVGTIATADPSDAYSFTVAANDLVTISMTATSGSLDTFLLLLDPQGNIVRSNDDVQQGVTDSQIGNALLTTPGTYTIVATRYGKRVGGTEGAYVLSVGTQATSLPEEFINLPRGTLEVTLLWNTDDDLQLLMRDPAGDAVYDDQPTIRSGALLGAQGNVGCTVTQSTPFSYIYYPQGVLPRPGIYEIEVWFQNACTDTAPVNFQLFATFNGQEIFNISAQPIANERFLISFTLEPDNTFEVSDGGIVRGLDTLPYQAEIENAAIIQAGQTLNGSIAQDNKFDVYVLQGTAGDEINIAMNATSGTLDPTLYLVGPFNNVVAENDDVEAGTNRNSLIANLTLPETGQYIIIATHFGALYGGTTGTYSLSVTQLN
jgi:hypothetical protein